jgi:Tfp pilus assembly protein PilW
MMVTFISSFVFAGVLSAYIFLGRGLARQQNEEVLESRARLALYYLTQDVSSASTITAQNPGVQTSGAQMTLNIPGTGLVIYSCDWSQGATQGTLSRQAGTNQSLTLLTNLSAFSFGYYDMTGTSVTAPSVAPATPQINIKSVYMAYTAVAGYAPSGAQSQFTVVSPCVIMKNKSVLTDPNDPP